MVAAVAAATRCQNVRAAVDRLPRPPGQRVEGRAHEGRHGLPRVESHDRPHHRQAADRDVEDAPLERGRRDGIFVLDVLARDVGQDARRADQLFRVVDGLVGGRGRSPPAEARRTAAGDGGRRHERAPRRQEEQRCGGRSSRGPHGLAAGWSVNETAEFAHTRIAPWRPSASLPLHHRALWQLS